MKTNISMVLMLSIMILGGIFLAQAKTVAAGAYTNADFYTPNYNNGGTETFTVGGTRTLSYKCYCSKSAACSGYMRLQLNTGSGFVNERSTTCNIAKNSWCSTSYQKTFSSTGNHTFRVFCDENTGTDFTQPSNEHVILTVQHICTNGTTRACPNQAGVCSGSVETCTNNNWPGCDYSGIQYYGAEVRAIRH